MVAAARRAERLAGLVERCDSAGGKAGAIVYAVTRPAWVNVNQILITSTEYVR